MAEGFKLLDAYVEVTASGKGLANKVAGDIERESTGSRSLGRTGSTMGGNLLGGLQSALGAGAVAGLVGGVAGALTSGLTNALGGVVGSTVSMAKSAVIDFNSTLENATIGFTTMLGSGQKAQDFLAQLQDFAKATPFEFKNLVSNAQQMMGMGIAAKDVIPDLKALGDSVASMGGSAAQVDQVTLAFSQMAAKGTLDMGNMQQLLQGGLPTALKVLASSYHVTTGRMIEMISSGKIASSDALPRLVKGIEGGTKATAALGGMMDKQSGTLTGSLSNIADALNQTLAKAGKPFFKLFEDGAKKLADFVSSKGFSKWASDTAKAMGNVVTKLKPFTDGLSDLLSGKGLPKMGGPFKGVTDGVKKLMDGSKHLFDSLKDSATKAKPSLDTFGKIVLPKILEVLTDIMPPLSKFGRFLADISPVLTPLGQAFSGLVKYGIKPMTEAVSNALDMVHDFGNPKQIAMDGLKGKFGDLYKNVSKALSGMSDALVGGVRAFGDFLHNGEVILKGIIDGFIALPGHIGDAIGGLSTMLGTIAHQMVDGLVGGLQNAWGAVTSTISSLVNAIPAAVRNLLGIHSPSKVFHLIGQQVGQGLHLGLLGSVDQIKVTSGKLADAVREAFSGHLETTMVHRIGNIAKALEHLSTARDKAAARLATDRTRLADVLTARKDFAANVKSGVMGNADTASLFGTSMQAQQDARQNILDANASATGTTSGAMAGTLNGRAYQPSWTTTTAARMLAVPKVSAHAGLAAVRASLRKLLTDTKTFNGNLGKLARMGIDPATYDELVQAGVRGGGLETSTALIHDPAMARSIFSLERQIGKAGGALGNRAAGHEYAGQVASARRAVAHDQRAVNHIEVHMVVEARKIDEVQKLVDMVEHVKSTARKRKARR